MDTSSDNDWKKKLGFPINYDSGQSSDDDFDTKDVVMRHPRQSSRFLLADGGDGSEADLLGTTPPRSRIRNKEKRRTFMDSGTSFQRMIKEKRDTVDFSSPSDQSCPITERLRKRASLKLIRNKERDWKQDVSLREGKADSLPVNFHKTFSMLINMGNIDKSCRRTISHEEQVWQNELKDLIWLELQAKIAGRTLAQQDSYLCTQRNIVPTLIKNISDYRFLNRNPCRNQSQRLNNIKGSQEDLLDKHGQSHVAEGLQDEEVSFGCLSFDCQQCSEAVGNAMREVSTLLDAFFNAVALYPSSKAMTADHPLIASQPFQNRLKAMCLWYNTALNMRMKLLAFSRMLRSIRLKGEKRGVHRASLDSNISRQSSESHRPCQVRFNVSNNPSDSSNSDSCHSDGIKEEKDPDEAEAPGGEREAAECRPARQDDEVDSGVGSTKQTGQSTPEIVIDNKYGTSDTTVSSESGYLSEGGAASLGLYPSHSDAFDIGPLEELTQLRLLEKCPMSLYREHHREILKTQGVRRCMMFIYKMRRNILAKAYLTLEKPDSVQQPFLFTDEDPTEVFEDAKEEDEKIEKVHDENTKKTYELRRFGCWSEECRSMRLPSYRSHFLLLSSICMEAVHDYLSFRLETRPEHPSCLTVKQLIHELKEGLDISSEMRVGFVRDLQAALLGRAAGAAAADLQLLLGTFDDTVEAVLKQYLSYMRTMSVTEYMSKSCLQTEWQFTARLAKRIKCATLLAPLSFAEIACNQLNRLVEQFNEQFQNIKSVSEIENPDPNGECEGLREEGSGGGGAARRAIYAVCRTAQGMYADSREATLVAAQWARALAQRLARAPQPAYLHQRADIFNNLMAVRDIIVMHVELVLEKSEGGSLDEWPRDVLDGAAARVRELLLQIFKLGFEIHKELHRFANDPIANRSASFGRRSMTSPPKLRAKFVRSDSVIEDYEASVFDDKLFDNFGDNQTQTSIELLLSGEQPAEPQVELRSTAGEVRISNEERQWAARVARAVIQFAKCWMQFVVARCDRGRGTRPRWACQGLEFLMLACDPCNTQHLTDTEFEELKQAMDSCISHVIGSRPLAPRSSECAPPATSPRPRHRLHSPLSSSSVSRDVPTPPTPPSEPEPLLSFHGPDSRAHRRRVLEAIGRVEVDREERLRELKRVGRVVGDAVSYEPKLRQLTFKWQRGLKIGAGTFGKVYTVVNTESGQLLAMKELSVGAGDRRALQRAANELRVLEGVIHPHLVRYYGCELHREEMLIFMELCVEGSLEALVGTSGGLAEHTVRRYTKQLVSAVVALHARNIAHRDIKSGNIFLTNEGHCLKLGDFGCAVKIRANTTAPYELQGFVGTQAYMAPEVFMKSSGHGRAADVWSLGCVVTEMASGKRPFSEYDYSNYQIMFMVGMGGTPHIPDSLSEEGRSFCLGCLTHDPDVRPRAEVLSQHHFLMVNSDDDCKCEPAFMI
ncbi:hypothetical protein K1T71_006417 [Dendrolimus kikuchii]|uniref:Uncharacterized protein n=1 Tax=Dendrolimus kikuchii TaxID=765133 RepID=A0ACC1D0T1_9NEOP|nr:hypothetical protein K1T71_006417 [Dendrolimus kikuchii]